MRIVLVVLILLAASLACNGEDSSDSGSLNGGGNGGGGGGSSGQTQPDLEITDLDVVETSGDDVDFTVTIHNRGSSINRDFVVRCEVPCRTEPGWSPTYFGYNYDRGSMGAGQSVTLGEGVWLNLGDCPFSTYREFTCDVDAENNVDESNEGNNTYSESIYTNR
ncbi:MAG: hypothetical protein GYB65_13510 [Chloroflexi bacterium]|nr:hypothetical protein [Chloroflexota bacterium]